MNNNSSNIHILKITTYRYGIVFHVKGSTGKEYIVDYNHYKGWLCDCPDHLFRKHTCKHIAMVQEYLKVKLNVSLPGQLWCDNPKSERVFENTLATEVIM